MVNDELNHLALGTYSCAGTGAALLGLGETRAIAASGVESSGSVASTEAAASVQPGRGVVAELTHILRRSNADHSIHHEITFEGREVDAEIEPGVRFSYMIFDGEAPGPMIRVRQGDDVLDLAQRSSRPRGIRSTFM